MLRDRDWKPVYRTGDDNILKDFYIPAISSAKLYSRAVGFFSVSLLVSAAAGLHSLIRNNGKMRLVIGHPLSEEEYDSLREGITAQEMGVDYSEKLTELLSSAETQLQKHRLSVISYLVATGALEVKFALRRQGMYHEKIGIIEDQSGEKLAFTGSANETMNAFDPSFNAESITVYESWKPVYEDYGVSMEQSFQRLWSNQQNGTITLDMPSEYYEKISRRVDVNHPPSFNEPDKNFDFDGALRFQPEIPSTINGKDFAPKAHQREALDAWRANSFNGILKLATGAGKTITSIYGGVKLYQHLKKLFVVIAVPYVELAKQWVEVLSLFSILPVKCYGNRKSWESLLLTKLNHFETGVLDFVCVVVVNRTLASEHFHDIISRLPEDSLFMIGDECHRHGASFVNEKLPKAKYKMGLSATPFNDDDDEIDAPLPDRNKANIKNYYGEIVSEYTLGDAIIDEVLTPYVYYPHPVYLTSDEQEEYDELSSRIARLLESVRSGSSNAQHEFTMLCAKRSRLLGMLENKLPTFEVVLSQNMSLKGHCLVYCPEGGSNQGEEFSHLEKVSSRMSALGWRVGRFTSTENSLERDKAMDGFVDGSLDALLAMKVLDEGIDVPVCRSAFILASTRNPRQYVQRRGRILRKAHGKEIAIIHDFITLPCEESDSPYARNLRNAEAERIYDFAQYANNQAQIMDFMNDSGIVNV